MAFTRRDFLQRGGLFLGLGMLAPSFVTRAVEAAGEMPLAGPTGGKTSLVVIQLGGGNDGLNTVVPYADETYYSLRPTLAIAQVDVLPMSGAVGLNPSLAALKPLYDNGGLAIVQGTDHGTAAPLFLFGSKLKGGLYGNSPSLTDLDTNGDLKFAIDFRQVYATLLQDWLGADATPVLDGVNYPSLGLIQSAQNA
jgi:uncharacterized protein (DUF1501 family)